MSITPVSQTPPAAGPPTQRRIEAPAALPDVQREGFTELPQDDRAAGFLQQTRNRTRPPRSRTSRPPLFNAPRLWYAHPTTGDIISAPGDATNQAYLAGKGFYKLSPEESEEWVTRVRPIVIEETRKRAHLITTLRRIAERHPGVELAGDLGITPLDQLQDMLTQLQTMTGGTVAVVMGRFREEAPMEESLEAQGIVIGGGDELAALKARPGADGRGRGRPRLSPTAG